MKEFIEIPASFFVGGPEEYHRTWCICLYGGFAIFNLLEVESSPDFLGNTCRNQDFFFYFNSFALTKGYQSCWLSVLPMDNSFGDNFPKTNPLELGEV